MIIRTGPWILRAFYHLAFLGMVEEFSAQYQPLGFLIWKVELPLLQKSCVKDLESFWQIKWSSFDLLSERPFKRTGKEKFSSKHKRNRNTWSKKSMFLQASSNVGMDVKNRQSQHLFASNTKTNKYAFYYLRPRTLGRLKMVKMKISQWASVFLWFRCFKSQENFSSLSGVNFW